MSTDPEILFERRGAIGLVTLNRPRALNALTHGMATALHARLRDWAEDSAVATIVVTAAGDRAFCAGGDIRALHDWGRAKDPAVLRFYFDEYRLNTYIKRYPKPYVALVDGIVMGGGVGVSLHGSHRVFTERAVFAMPETGIGLFPDVGGTWFLPRCPGETGLYLGLTGARIKAADAAHLGLATHEAASRDLPAIIDALAAGRTPDLVLGHAAQDMAPLAAHRGTIDRCFGAPSVEEILIRLQAEGSTFAMETEAVLRQKSPTSLKVTFAQLRAGAKLGFEACMRLEYRLTNRFMAGHDFYEGVRAVIIDKDQSPRWRPDRLEDVSEADVAAYFAPLEAELTL